MKKFFHIVSVLAIFTLTLASCSEGVSYSDLLKEEQKASNWFLAQHRVCNDIPADSVFLTGSDAPFYKLDDDGYVYMQVVSAPEKKDRVIPSTGEQVYFTYTRYNIEEMYAGDTLEVPGEGNQSDFINATEPSYFIFNNLNVSSSYKYGSGIQKPLSYLGYNSEVNILLKSYYGFSEDSATGIPYLVNTRYFKAEY